ncbi:MAG: alginate lyase family protein [Pyrinomonadaceae bacterium]
MTAAMAKPLDKIKKLRSLDEILTRGGQAISVYREQRRGRLSEPTNEEFAALVDADQFGSSPIIAESLWQKFFENGEERFFPSLRLQEKSVEVFRDTFGAERVDEIIACASRIVDGRIDLLGFTNLYVGTDIDWHREPISGMRSPLKHWKYFDDLNTTETGNKKIVWELNRHQHFFTLGVAYWLTGDERYAMTFARQLESWMDANPPGLGINWASSLEVSFRAMSWIWAFHFFVDSPALTVGLFHRAIKYLYLHGRHIESYLSTYYSPNTHLTGEALGLYYLGTQLPFLERARHWRKLGENIMFAEVRKQILDDGVYFEQSTWYQRYTTDFYAQFVVLRSLFGDPYFNAQAAALDQALENSFDFLMHITLPDGKTPIIGDDDGGRLLPLTGGDSDDFRGTLAVGTSIFGRGDHKFVAGPASEEVFWLMGSGGVRTYNDLTACEPELSSRGFPDGGYFVMRDGWTDTDNYLIVDCGDVGSLAGGHGHADALSIEMAVGGKTLLVDSGTYTYHESRVMRDYFRSTRAHNTVEIDDRSSSEPGNPFSWKSRAKCTASRWIAEERFDLFEGSHSGYQRLASGAVHARSILFLKNDYWIIRDVIETAGEHEYSLNFHFDKSIAPVPSLGGRCVGDANHRIFTFGDNGGWQQKESWVSNNHGKRVHAPFLRFVSSGVGTQEFFTFIVPVTSSSRIPEISESPLAEGRAFVVEFGEETDLFVYSDRSGQLIDNGIFQSDFRYSWARMQNAAVIPDEFVLIDGGRLDLGDNMIFDPHELNYASARRYGCELYIKTDLGRKKKQI